MASPLYRVKASGLGGSGYGRPPLPGEPSKTVKNADGNPIEVVVDQDEKPIVVPGVTTVLKAFGAGGGLVQWSVDQVAAYAVANVDALLNRTMEQGYSYLRWYHKRTPDISDPLRSAHSGVLNDLAELGTKIHEWTQADLVGDAFPPPIDSVEMAQMVEAWKSYRFGHSIKPYMTEVTVYGDGFAGTFDGLWYMDGKLSLLDEKTSRRVHEGHLMQLAALREALRSGSVFVKNEAGEWEDIRETIPQPEEYGILQFRPDDSDNQGNPIPRFCHYHTIDEAKLDLYYQRFLHGLGTLQIDRELRQMEKADKITEEE